MPVTINEKIKECATYSLANLAFLQDKKLLETLTPEELLDVSKTVNRIFKVSLKVDKEIRDLSQEEYYKKVFLDDFYKELQECQN
jgi:hypothetical protein